MGSEGLWRVAKLYIGRVQDVIVDMLISLGGDILRILMMMTRASRRRFRACFNLARIWVCAFPVLYSKARLRLCVVFDE